MTVYEEGVTTDAHAQGSVCAGSVKGNVTVNNYGTDDKIILEKVKELFKDFKDDMHEKLGSIILACLKKQKHIRCKNCNKKVSKSKDIILSLPVDTLHCLLDKWKDDICDVEDVLVQKVLNIQQRIIDFFCCDEASVKTDPEIYHDTFYHDYDGRIARCSICEEQVGWVFDLKNSEPKSEKRRKFFAIFPNCARY